MPSTPADAKGLLISSIRDEDPVMFLEPKRIYRDLKVKGDVPVGEHVVRLGEGRIVQEGTDCTIVTWGAMVPVGPRFSALGAINRSAALCELGRYAEAARCLGAAPPRGVPLGARAYLHNNLAWGLALGGGDPQAALEHARKAVRLRARDPALSGTLGLCMLVGGEPPEAALPHLLASLEHVQRRSPMGRATLVAAAALAYRSLGREGRAAALERELAALPRGLEGRLAIEAAAPAPALPAE